MTNMSTKKRTQIEQASRPSKKLKRQTRTSAQGDDDGEEAGSDFKAVNLLDSDEDDIHNAVADDAAASDDSFSSSGDESINASSPNKISNGGSKDRKEEVAERRNKSGEGSQSGDDNAGSESESDESDDQYDADDGEEGNASGTTTKKSKSKRNDPTAFATSMSKILSTKLPTARRADPVLSRSAAAHEASRAVADAALEQKARRQLRMQKRLAQEKGRVRDVLIATRNDVTDEPMESTGEMLEAERRHRKVAQRGVVKLFNAVRAAQVKAAEAQRAAQKDGVLGVSRKEAKVTEMSKKGFLDLIASGGGGLKKGPLDEA